MPIMYLRALVSVHRNNITLYSLVTTHRNSTSPLAAYSPVSCPPSHQSSLHFLLQDLGDDNLSKEVLLPRILRVS